MAKSKLLTTQLDGLNDTAKAEAERLWALRDTNQILNDATLPLICLYASAWAQARQLATDLDDPEKDYDQTLQRLEKTQKIVLTYAKLLKLDTKPNKASKNKFFDLLTK